MKYSLPSHFKDTGMDILELTSREKDVVRAHLTAHIEVPARATALALGFCATMLKRGSARYTKDAYEEKLEVLGAQVAIHGAEDSLEISITARTAVLKDVLAILRDTLLHPRFAQGEITKLKKEYLQAFHEEEDNTRARASDLFLRTLYTPREASFTPDLKTRRAQLAKVDTAMLRAIHALCLSAPWVVSVAGDTRARAQVLETARAIHTEKTRTAVPQIRPTAVPARTEYIEVSGKQNIEFFIGNRLPLTLKDDDFLAFSFGLDVLGKRGGFAGRLMSTVREKEGLTYMIYAWIRGATATECGHFNISTFFTPKDAPKGISSTLREVHTIVEKGISVKDLTKFKELLTNQFRLAHESTSSVLALYHASLTAGRTPREVRDYPDRITALTQKDVNKALKTYLNPKALVIVGAGPTKGLRK